MGLAVKVYEVFKDDEAKAKVLAEAFDELEARTSHLKNVTTKEDLEVTKLALQKEIEEVRLSLQKEIKEVEANLRERIEKVRADLIKWVAALLIIQGGVIVSLIKLLP